MALSLALRLVPRTGRRNAGKMSGMDETLDLRGLKCPLPALMAAGSWRALAPGETITVLASDPLAVVDIPHMCGEEGHALIASTGGRRTAFDHHGAFLIRRGTRAGSTLPPLIAAKACLA